MIYETLHKFPIVRTARYRF